MQTHWILGAATAFAACLAVLSCEAPPAARPADAPPSAEAASTDAVAAAIAAQREKFAAAPPTESDPASAYQFAFEGLTAPLVPLTAFKGEVLLVVNTASECGFTPQYAGLQSIYAEYEKRGFAVLGVPSNNFGAQEPGSAKEIQDFCAINYGVTFPMAGKTEVIGAQAHPFYRWAQGQLGDAAVPGWNFHKLLIGRDGRLLAAFPSATEPGSPQIRAAIEDALS